MKLKEFKTLDEQIEILQSRGMVINDIEKTKSLLLRENYFFISGYRHMFLKSSKDKNFIEGTTFEELYAVFQFDRSFRNLLFKNFRFCISC
jgi:abortive infection bacteriophage resistance protein